MKDYKINLLDQLNKNKYELKAKKLTQEKAKKIMNELGFDEWDKGFFNHSTNHEYYAVSVALDFDYNNNLQDIYIGYDDYNGVSINYEATTELINTKDEVIDLASDDFVFISSLYSDLKEAYNLIEKVINALFDKKE